MNVKCIAKESWYDSTISLNDIMINILPYFVFLTFCKIIMTKILGNYFGKPIAIKSLKNQNEFNRLTPKLRKINEDTSQKWKINTILTIHKNKQTIIKNKIKKNRLANKSTIFYISKDELNTIIEQTKLHKFDVEIAFHHFDYIRDINELSIKINDEFWKFCTVLFISLLGLNLLFDDECEFFSNPNSVYNIWPQIINQSMLQYYSIQGGYHLNRLLWFNNHGKDKIAMFIHHLVTIILIVISWKLCLMQSGILVFMIHDNADIWLPLCKLTRWIKYDKISVIVFVIFAISWPIFRIYGLATYVILPIINTAWYAYDCITSIAKPLMIVFVSLLIILLTLHCYWFYFISIAGIKAIKGEQLVDTRNEDHNASQSPS